MSLQKDLRGTLAFVRAPGVTLPPWKVDASPGTEGSARGNSTGIMGGCCIEHAHDGDESDACVLTEFAVVWNNDARLPAHHWDNRKQVATAMAMVEAFNFLSRYGDELLAKGEGVRSDG